MVRIGISGWRYEPWRRVWYPEGLPQHRELEFCGWHFPSVEINGSFYSLQRPEYYEEWYRDTPEGFLFAVKGSRYITHMLRLTKIEKPLANFFASGILALRDKLGPFLWQFPPMFAYRRDRLAPFLDALPKTMEDALRLARRRDARMHGARAWRSMRTGRCAMRWKSAPELHERRFRRAPARARYRSRRRRHCGQVAEDVPRHVRLRVRASARRCSDLHQRVHRSRALELGAAHPRLA